MFPDKITMFAAKTLQNPHFSMRVSFTFGPGGPLLHGNTALRRGQGWGIVDAITLLRRRPKYGGYVLGISTLWLFNIAMGNGPFIEVYLLKMVIFHGYVSHNQRV
jgi:hypothetical protein